MICQETRDLSCLALLFQITCPQYLLSATSGTTFVVSAYDDGVVKCFIHTKILPFDLTTRFGANAIPGLEAGNGSP